MINANAVVVELGVQFGHFSSALSSKWTNPINEYVMVDLWARQENYNDAANDYNHTIIFSDAMNVKTSMESEGKAKKVTVCRNFTSICVKNFPSQYFDFIYVDARHDYKGVLADITEWWPKLKVGGIMAGHD